jgi:hypothetical protein
MNKIKLKKSLAWCQVAYVSCRRFVVGYVHLIFSLCYSDPTNLESSSTADATLNVCHFCLPGGIWDGSCSLRHDGTRSLSCLYFSLFHFMYSSRPTFDEVMLGAGRTLGARSLINVRSVTGISMYKNGRDK